MSRWFAAWAAVGGCTERLVPNGQGPEGVMLTEGQSPELVWEAVPTTTHPVCDRGAAVYDAARQEVLYVGLGSVYQMPWAACNSTWSYDGSDWTEVADAVQSPPWRIESALAYDPVRERVVLFGGKRIQGNAVLTREVWEWDGATWSDRTPPATAVQPVPMSEPGLAFDPITGRMLMFGGTVPNQAMTDTWSWDGASWTRIDSDGPWHFPHATWDGQRVLGVGNGIPGFGGWELLSWDGAGWTSGWTGLVGAPWVVHDPSPGVTLLSTHPSQIYWLGPDGIELRATTGEPLPNTGSWSSGFFVYDPVRDRTVTWNAAYGDTVMELDARATADVPPEFVDPPDVLAFEVGYETSHLVSAIAPDGDPLTLRLEDLPPVPYPVLVPYTSAWGLRWEPEVDQIGSRDVTLVLSDGTSEVRHSVRLDVGLRDLPGFPTGQFVAEGHGVAVIGEVGSTVTTRVDVDCSLTVDNPGTADLGCSASFPFWIRVSDAALNLTTETLVDRVRLGSGDQGVLFEEWGSSDEVLPIGVPWTRAWGAIRGIEGGWLVTVAPTLPSRTVTSIGTLDETLVTIELAEIELWAPVIPAEDLRAGDLVITEIMRNPARVADTAGEWFELSNTSGYPVDLEGLEISDDGSDRHVVDVPLIVEAGGTVVFAVDGDPSRNGGVTADGVVDDTILANGPDELIVGVAGVVFDAVRWDNTWPSPNGASMSLQPGESATTNDDPSRWCAATGTYGAGDRGSPGSINPGC